MAGSHGRKRFMSNFFRFLARLVVLGTVILSAAKNLMRRVRILRCAQNDSYSVSTKLDRLVGLRDVYTSETNDKKAGNSLNILPKSML